MRPSSDTPERTVFECPACGRRETDPDGRHCPCGGELRNVARPRDL